MVKNPLKILLGCVNIFLYAVLTFFFAILILLGGLVVWVIPTQSWRYHTTRLILKLPVLWTSTLSFIMRMNSRHKIHFIGDPQLFSTKKWYILVANHVSWLDILILGYTFNHKIPIIKFFMKKELLWSLPIAGVSCWILGYPFMSKHSRKAIRKNPKLKRADIESAKKACEKFMKYPTTVMNFVEGSRFTNAKRERQGSPFKHLLKPSAGGVAIVLNELKDYISGIVNVTLQYDPHATMSFWKFACNDFKAVYVYYDLIPITPNMMGDYYKDRQYRKDFQRWLNNLWQQKEIFLD